MKQIGRFVEKANNPTMHDTVDPNGSTVDSIFADAILTSMPTLVVDKYGLAMVKEVPDQVDNAIFPVFSNFNLTWNNLTESGSANNGSVITLTAGQAATFQKCTPVLYSAGLFVADVVDLQCNKADFEIYSKIAGIQVAKKIDTVFLDALEALDTSATNRYSAGGFTASGSIAAASTLTPSDLSEAKRLLSTGSDIYAPDVILMHPNQFLQVSLHQDFSLTSSTGAARKAKFDGSGALVNYDGMDIVVTELINTRVVTGGSALEWTVAGHPVYVFKKGLSLALAKKSAAFKVNTVDDRIRHGKFKVFDIMVAAKVLVEKSIVYIRAAD